MRSVLLYVSPRIDAVGSEGGSATDNTMKERAVGVAPGGGRLTENHFVGFQDQWATKQALHVSIG